MLIVLYDPELERCYWQLIDNSTLEKTKGAGRRVKVPDAQILDESAVAALRDAADGDPYELRLRQLRLARSWMRLLVDGKRLVIDIEEWVNKTSGRGAISLGIDNEDGKEPERLATWGVFLGSASYAEVIPRLFAWADVDIHQDTYDDSEYEHWQNACTFYDEGDRFEYESYADWRARQPSGLRPYNNGAGEVEFWRLELTLGHLGRAFLIVDDFASNGSVLLTS